MSIAPVRVQRRGNTARRAASSRGSQRQAAAAKPLASPRSSFVFEPVRHDRRVAPPPTLAYEQAMSESPTTPPLLGLRHLALSIAHDRYAATLQFYRDGMGMQIDWQPDDDAVYLTSGTDNLALHRVDNPASEQHARARSGLDHLGFMVPNADAVAAWYARLSPLVEQLGIEILAKPRLHRDGATSFYLLDPAGNKVQIRHMPSISA
jgi:catechol 2,3-dioxygenase-like lactoylglutathione lyase family enzyme